MNSSSVKIVLTKRTPFSTPDGISHFLFSLANEFLSRGHEVIGITTKDSTLDKIAERFAYPHLPRVIALSEEEGQGYWFEGNMWWQKGSAVVAAQNPDLVLVNGAVPCRYAAPSVTIAHDADQRSFHGASWPRRFYKAFTYRCTDRLVTTCSELVSAVARDAFFPAEKIKIIPTCLTPELYHPKPLSERRPVVVHVGMQEYKNPRATIAAFLPLVDRATLIMVGKIDSDVRQYIDTLPLHQRSKIELPGILPDSELKQLLETARIVSVPSRYHVPVASPTVLEAFAAHTPVVASSCISRDLLQPGINGLLANDESERAEAFQTLLSDDDKWQQFSQKAAETAQRFNATDIANRYLSLFSTLRPNQLPV